MSTRFSHFKQVFEQIELLAKLYRAIADFDEENISLIEEELKEKYPGCEYRKPDVFTPWAHTKYFIQEKGFLVHSGWKEAEFDINYQFEVERGDGNTIKTRLLHLAAECGFKEVVKALIDNGAKPLLKNSEDKIPLDLAKNSETKLILLEASKKEISSNKTDRKIKMGVSGVGAVSAVGVALYTTNIVDISTTNIVAISTASMVAFICLAAFVYNAYQFREIKEVETEINNMRLEPVVGEDTGVTTQ